MLCKSDLHKPGLLLHGIGDFLYILGGVRLWYVTATRVDAARMVCAGTFGEYDEQTFRKHDRPGDGTRPPDGHSRKTRQEANAGKPRFLLFHCRILFRRPSGPRASADENRALKGGDLLVFEVLTTPHHQVALSDCSELPKPRTPGTCGASFLEALLQPWGRSDLPQSGCVVLGHILWYK